jgi:uncharacterized protein
MHTTPRNTSFSLRFVLVLSLAVAGVTGAAGRAVADADPKVTMELVQLVTPQETYQMIVTTMTTQMMASLQQSGAKMPADAANKMSKAVMEALPYKDLAQWIVEIYASHFTTDEIKQMITFYKTPVGKKAAKLLPEISGETSKKMGPIVMQRLPAAMKKVGLTP